MKVVIISQVCYPNLSPRGHRTTELAKEMARKGHDVTVYALLGDYDYSELSAKTRIKFKNLGRSKLGLTSNTGVKHTSILVKAIKRMIGKYIHFPDIELIPMIKRAIESEGSIDCLISIAVPHVNHYAVAKSDRTKIKRWIADCGDPFMGNPFHNPPKYFEKYERYWCEQCDYIMIPVNEAINGYYKEYHNKIRIIPQGYDFNSVRLASYKYNEVPTFGYAGVVYKDRRDPTNLLEYLKGVNYKFKFVVYTASISLFEPYKNILGDRLELRERVQRDKLLFELSKMDFLLNIANESGVQQPSKLIDYSLSNRPIVEISSMFNKSEQAIFEEFINKDYTNQTQLSNLDDYNIVNVVNKIDNLCK